eukprot:TRINITY_DN419_c1_g1_i1.p1 TRINITY_DN419_c1_g1~~TRINITY_DN419_c1_g1_i1.p1  ORF type:complete len:101 (-),score=19.61 TRINITY_DN419_c1_g1_i1:65-367(-)
MPFSGKTSSLMHPGGDHLLCPVMEKNEYEVMDYQNGEVTVLDSQNEEKILPLPEDSDLGMKLQDDIEVGNLCVVTTLEGPIAARETYLLEMIQSYKIQKD